MMEKVFESDPKLKNLFEVSEATKLLEKRRVLADTDEMYQKCYQRYKEDMRNFLEQEERFKETDLLMQERFVKAHKTIVDNNSKKRRADQHANEERQMRLEKAREFEAERKRLEELEEQRQRLNAGIAQLQPLEEYLQSAVKAAPEIFSSVPELMQRFENLQQTNLRLRGHESENRNQLEKFATAANTLEKDRHTTILLLTNKQSELQKKVETLEARNAQMRSGLESREEAAVEMSKGFAKLMLAIDNIHEMAVQLDSVILCRRRAPAKGDIKKVNPTLRTQDFKEIYLKKLKTIENCLVNARKIDEFSKKTATT